MFQATKKHGKLSESLGEFTTRTIDIFAVVIAVSMFAVTGKRNPIGPKDGYEANSIN